jgi:hypothetical protein
LVDEPKEQAERPTLYFLLTDGPLRTGKHLSRPNLNECIGLLWLIEKFQQTIGYGSKEQLVVTIFT